MGRRDHGWCKASTVSLHCLFCFACLIEQILSVMLATVFAAGIVCKPDICKAPPDAAAVDLRRPFACCWTLHSR
jgi:hypothetical protein